MNNPRAGIMLMVAATFVFAVQMEFHATWPANTMC